MLTEEERQRVLEIRARHTAATLGPWHWQGNMSAHQIELCSASPFACGDRVMTFARWGTQDAVPTFINRSRGIIERAMCWFVRPESHNSWRITGIDHPDAIFIEHASEDVKDLLAMVESLAAVTERTELC